MLFLHNIAPGRSWILGCLDLKVSSVLNYAARNIGVTMDDKINFEKQVASICKSSFYHIRNIACIRRFLSEESTEALVHAFVTCRLDNCNSLLYGLPKNQIEKLQRVQNCAARLVVNARRHDHITPVLRHLHWLPVEQLHVLTFKILLFTFKALNSFSSFLFV